MNRWISFRPLHLLPAVALALLSASPSFAADEKAKDDKPADKPKDDKPAAPAAEPAPAPAPAAPAAPAADATAPATTSGTASVDASASTSGGVAAVAEAPEVSDAEGPSPEHAIETAPGAFRCSKTPLAAGDHPEYKDRECYEGRLESKNVYLYGGLELDLGYAKYTYKDQPQGPYENFYDMRGRFVVGPMLHHEFGDSGYWVRATGQMVGWVREQAGSHYQINVDDVYGQVGGRAGSGHWDLQVGRFMTWRVYQKGLGYDLYTLEDNGAAKGGSAAAGAVYGVHTYEVNYIYYRNATVNGNEQFEGRAALHYFPARFLGFELTGAYGQSQGGAANSLGGRLAADFHKAFGPVLARVSVGAEDRFETQAKPKFNQTGLDANNQPIYKECPDCNVRDYKGLGGSAVVKAFIVELGGGFAKGWDLAHSASANTVGAPRDPALTGIRTSYGGYLQLDPGKLLIKRSLIVGVGLQHSEWVADTTDYEEHLQGAAYIAFPLGFNDAMVKLVVSRAELSAFTHTTAPGEMPIHYNEYDSAMTAARLRFAYYF
ncbi:MAG TPA: hypothetical protein VNN72_30435 [Polyangiaceae bacterium]|nr:hypothetical protein [Polyangiaceae bacterium]